MVRADTNQGGEKAAYLNNPGKLLKWFVRRG
jgi:hypothetical protein